MQSIQHFELTGFGTTIFPLNLFFLYILLPLSVVTADVSGENILTDIAHTYVYHLHSLHTPFTVHPQHQPPTLRQESINSSQSKRLRVTDLNPVHFHELDSSSVGSVDISGFVIFSCIFVRPTLTSLVLYIRHLSSLAEWH